MTLTSSSWLKSLVEVDGVMRHVSAKGSIIKFCIVENESDHSQLRDNLVELHRREDVNLLSVNSGLADVSLPENIVKQLASGLDVARMIDNFVKRAWHDAGYPNNELKSVANLAVELSVGLPALRAAVGSSIRRLLGLSEDTAHVPAFNRDFRNALEFLSHKTVEEGASSWDRSQMIAGFNMWLSGTAPAHILRILNIQWKLKRTNASQILRSLLALPPLIGVKGSILHLDFRSVTNPQLLSGMAMVNYTKNRRTGTYQWLREIIDQAYMFDSTLIIVEAGPSFVDQSSTGPGIGRYDALKFRILDDVVAGRDNPSAVVTRIAG